MVMPDVVADLKAVMIRNGRGEDAILESDLICYSEDEVRCFAFHAGKFLLSGKSKHLALCGRCQERIQGWIEFARGAEQRAREYGSDFIAQA